MFQCLFPSSKRTPYGKNQRKYNGYTEQGKINLKKYLKAIAQEYGGKRDYRNQQRPVI
jgi:hypothetical protein